MRIAILGSEYSWSVKRIEEEAEKRGHGVDFIRMKDIVIEMDPKLKVTVNGIRDMKVYDVVLRRRIISNFMQSLVATAYMKRKRKVVISSHLDIGQSLDDKMTQAIKFENEGVPHLPVFQALSNKNAIKLLKKVDYPIIIKGLVGTKGKRVFKAGSRNAALKILKKEEYSKVLIQEFVDIKNDYRVFVIGKRVVGGMKRKIPEGEYRANVAQGAEVEKVKISKSVRELAKKSVRVLGYEIAGVDIIYRKKKPRILEVNASPGFKGFNKATEKNVEKEIVDYVERRVRRHKKNLRKGKAQKDALKGQTTDKTGWQKFIGVLWEK